MQAKISNSLLAKLTPAAKPYEVNDTELKGFLIRVQPTGTLAYYCAYRACDGKRNRISLGRHPTVTSAQARDHAKQILAGVIKGENPADRRKATQTGNLFDFLDGDYGPWVIAHRKDGQATIDRIRSRFQSLKATSLDTLTPAVIERWRTKRLSAGISPATVNRDIASLRSALSKAVEWKLIDSHPMASVKPLKIDSSQIVRFLSEDEEKRLRSAIDSREEKRRVERDSANDWRLKRQVALLTDLRLVPFTDHLKPMILISINTGIRQGELFNLRWQDVDLHRANLTITGNTAKSGKTRHIPLNSEALHAFNEWATGSNNENLVFPSTDGRPFDNVKKSWAELLKDAKIEQFRWHDMRHHFASRLVMAGVDINTVRELLGHGDLKMTLRYAHLAPEHKAAAVAKLVRQND